MKLYIALCDDKTEILAYEARIISDILTEKGIAYELNTFNSPKDLLASDVIYNMAFLDIEMDEMNGIDLATQLSKKIKIVQYSLLQITLCIWIRLLMLMLSVFLPNLLKKRD